MDKKAIAVIGHCDPDLHRQLREAMTAQSVVGIIPIDAKIEYIPTKQYVPMITSWEGNIKFTWQNWLNAWIIPVKNNNTIKRLKRIYGNQIHR